MIIPDDLHIASFEDFMPNAFTFNNNIITNMNERPSHVNLSQQIAPNSESIATSSSSFNTFVDNYSESNPDNEDPNSQGNLNSKRKFFTKHEDHLLTIAAIKYHQESWNSIAQCVPGRTPKQCRDRWVNYLQPTLKFDPWSENEDQLLVSLVNMHGTHWTKMKNHFPNRSSNSLKNRWYWLIKNQIQIIPVDNKSATSFTSLSNVQVPINQKSNESYHNDFQFNNFMNLNYNNNQTNICINNPDMVNSLNVQQQNDNQKYCYYLMKGRMKRKNFHKYPLNSNNIKTESLEKSKKKKKNKNNPNSQKIEEEDIISILPEELDW